MAIYSNYDPIPVDKGVELIPKEFVKLNTKTFGSEVKDVDADKFRKAILLKREKVSYRGGKNNIMQGGHGSTMEYTVRFLDTKEEETFRTDPRKYYFKTLIQPVTGGKRRLQKTKKNKKYKKRTTRKH